MTKPKKWAELQEIRQHLTQLGYPRYIIDQKMEAHPWHSQFQRTATSGTSYAKRI